MKTSIVALCSVAVTLFTLANLGCGTNNFSVPVTGVASTSSPLVAQYSIRHFHPGLTAWVEFGTDTTYGRRTSEVTATDSTLNILVAGMKPQTTYHMRAHGDWAGGSWVDQDQTFTTGAIPTSASAPLPQFSVTVPAPGSGAVPPSGGVELFSLIPENTFAAVATDLQGNVIWYCPGTVVPVKLMTNGHFMINRNTVLDEVDLLCNTVREVSITQVNQSIQANPSSFPPSSFPPLLQFHHDVVVLPNGHWIVLAAATKDYSDLTGYPGTTAVLGDFVLDIDPNGNVAWAWSSFGTLDITRYIYFGMPDWTHSNALVYTNDGNLLVSSRAQSWILKLDYANGTGSGDVLWKLGQGGDFTLLGADSSQWFYAQHYPYILSVNGSQTTMAIYDDGNFRVGADGVLCGSTSSAPACYTRATIFQIDESTKQASVQWQYLPGFFSFWGGSIDVLSNGNVEFNSSEPFGSAVESQVTEVTPSVSPQIVWQMNITGAFAYRGDRIPSLYPGVTWQK